jgi:membrane protease subunit (stomatin/prohibitin family)
MGILDFTKKQFIDVIDWTEPGQGILSYRYPMQDREIQNGAQLTVRESQIALFVNEGRIADVFFAPGRYTLTTKTLPLLTNLMNWDKLFASPFKSDVYFFSAREQLDQKWGTLNPVTIRDKEFGPIRIRAFGIYSYRIKEAPIFYQKISGTRDVYTVQELEGQLRSSLLATLSSTFGQSPVAFVDMAASQTDFSDRIRQAVTRRFEDYGLELTNLFVESISLPEELQQRFDKASSMRILGDLPRYAQFQTAEAIGTAAQNEGGMAGAGAGLGAGMAVGQTMAAAMTGLNSGNQSPNAENPMATIDRLHELLKKGAITQGEFDAKKAELLGKIK